MFNIKEDDKKLKNMTFIDLFCGIGGFHFALSSYGCKCVLASEINEQAKKVYYNNFKIMPEGDIKELKNSDIKKCDIICAGFPCQPFSISGKGLGFDDENGKLFYEIVKVIKQANPKMILLENVKNLVNHDEGNTLKKITKAIEEQGYNVFWKVISATDFSVPQARKRVYFVAFREDYDSSEFKFPEKRKIIKVVEDILEDNPDERYYINKEYNLIDQIEIDQIKKDKIGRIGSVGLGRQGERIYSINAQGITLSSQGGGIAGKTGMYLVNDRVRKLTPKECARMMGFPKRFKLSESESESYKQFGNSVVVNVLQEIIKESIKVLEQGEKNGKCKI